MNSVLGKLLDALYPRDVACFACNREARVDQHGLCEECAPRIHTAGVLDGPPGMSGLYAAFWYEEPLHPAVYRFKYGGAKYLAWHFASCMQLPQDWRVDAVVPVPLSARRQRERGYNQSGLIARMLSERYGFPTEPALLARVRDTAVQAGLSAGLRAQNVEGAFVASPAAKGRALLLVDDVVTTGSTLSACAATLLKAGAAQIYAACACAAPAEHVGKEEY
jgi:ComF family protein